MQYLSARNSGCRIKEYTFNGYTNLRLENDLISVNVLVEKGADITEIIDKKSDIDFMWKSPYVAQSNYSRHIPTVGSQMGNFHDYYEGGWHEVFPGGGPYTDRGVELGLHGEIALLPWRFFVVKDTEEEIVVRLDVKTIRYPFYVEKRISLKKGSGVIGFEETITNLSGQDLEFMWGHHPVVGAPFLDKSCRIDLPADYFVTDVGYGSRTTHFEEGSRQDWPVSPGKDGKNYDLSKTDDVPNAELMYFPEIKGGWCAITNTDLKIGIGFAWDKSVFNTIWYWRVLEGLYDYPWFGRVYCIGLEFWNGYPKYNEAKEQGRIKVIKGYGKIPVSYCCVVYEGIDKVSRIDQSGNVK